MLAAKLETVVAAYLEHYREESWERLRERLLAKEIDVPRVSGDDGEEYAIEVTFHWDGKREGAIRVTATIDEWGRKTRLFIPTSPRGYDDFIKAPDGSFVDEA